PEPSAKSTRLLAFVAQRRERGVATAGAVHAGARVRVARSKVERAHRRAVAEVREHRAEEELVLDRRGAAGDVAADEVLVHRFEIGGRGDGGGEDAVLEARCEAFDAIVDAIGEALFPIGPTALEREGHARVSP